jgi:3-hydroxyisobutyrate dehydrogenase-like beta-hydroxyacid dehydrogenase
MESAHMTQDASTIAQRRIGIIGYGEVGQLFGAALVAAGVAQVKAFDIALDDPARRGRMVESAERDRLQLTASASATVVDCDLVISAVTASATREAAAGAAGAMRKGAFFLDINSASPGTKADCGALVAASGGRYVEAAVMNAVPPYGIGVPMLIGGPDAAAAAPTLAALGFAATIASDRLGVASAIKMCRSVVLKGMEAIVIESYVAARRYGVENEVLASLAETFPGMDWERNGDYFFSRVIQHGQRRAEEMREAAATVREAGLEPFMAGAIADRQAWVAKLARDGSFARAKPAAGWRECADAIGPKPGG